MNITYTLRHHVLVNSHGVTRIWSTMTIDVVEHKGDAWTGEHMRPVMNKGSTKQCAH